MAEIRNNFIRSKMNKDLDARLVPPGEYRDAQNVSVSRSEGDDVGALENVLGNISLTDFGLSNTCNADVIGKIMHPHQDRIFLFLTNYVDTSTDKISNYSYGNSVEHYIAMYDLKAATGTLLVGGNFLNFSKTHEIYGVNVISDLLFWTDNRNQPRKINIENAYSNPYIDSANPGYYTTEDQISVSKYYPFEPIKLYKTVGGVVESTMKDVTSEYLPAHQVAVTSAVTGAGGFTFTFTNSFYNDTDRTLNINDKLVIPSVGVELIINSVGTTPSTSSVTTATAPGVIVPAGSLVYIQRPNPNYNVNWPGDKKFLNDKFVRFSYRFKFEDNEYSLIAPFTQECFIPNQDGYFIGDDESTSFKSTEVKFVENKVDNIELIIPSPSGITQFMEIATKLKVKEIDIIYKQSNESVLKVVDTLELTDFNSTTDNYYSYEYQSQKPWRTLPQKDLIRVQDQVPIRALGQEVVANRIVYANYVNKPTPPSSINYNVKISEKFTEDQGGYLIKEYQNHNVKQNRNYQVGVVLSDRYGRQSDVILSSIDPSSVSAILKASTLFNAYKSGGSSDSDAFSYFPTTSAEKLYSPRVTGPPVVQANTWPGDSLKMIFNRLITSTRSSLTGEPGLYNGDSSVKGYNPLGWYSYKIVVKQTEQEYYNIYFPGLLNGYIDGEFKNPLAASVNEPIGHFVLASDNINKVPKDLNLVGPDQTFFRTGRPSPEEDPSYYEFINTDGVKFTADPYTEEGEQLLRVRDRQRDLDIGSQVTNASVKLFPRILNYSNNVPSGVTGVYVSTPGTGYTNSTGVATTGGTGTGLTVDTTTAAGAITSIVVNNAGSGYKIGDVIGISGGGANAEITVYEIEGTHNSQIYPNESEDLVATIGTGSELGLWNPAADAPYNVAPVFYGYENNPYIAKVVLANWQLGVTGPSPYAGTQEFTITNITPGTGYTAPSTNIATEPKEDTGYGVGLLVNIDKVTAGNVDNLSIANEGTGWKGSFTGITYSSIKVTGAGNQDCVFDLTVKNVPWPGKMSPEFSVYENEPVESKLDIYWESSTAGLISELNTNISNSDSYTPYFTSNITWNWNENQPSGTDITNDFYPQNANGVNLTDATNTATLLSVMGHGGTSYPTSLFNLLNNGDGSFKIQTNSTFYAQFLYPTIFFNWVFTVEFTCPDGGASTVSNILTITDNSAGIANAEPVFDATFVKGPSVTVDGGGSLVCGSAVTVSGVSTNDRKIGRYIATNGSADVSYQYDGVSFDVDNKGEFYLSSVPNTPGHVDLYVKQGTSIGSTFNVTITAEDLGIATSTCTVQVTTAT